MTSTIIVKAHPRRKPEKPTDPFHADIQLLLARRRSTAVERDLIKAFETLKRFQEKRRQLDGITEGLI
ncbi:UNVERIFIED_ORG: hypothetical protein J2W19_003195 [Shinella zoogloeoides]|nr:hypothetical protein [Shinella zoogloeoides]